MGEKRLLRRVQASEPELLHALSERFTALREDRRFIDAVSGHIPPDETSQERVTVVLKMIGKIAESQ